MDEALTLSRTQRLYGYVHMQLFVWHARALYICTHTHPSPLTSPFPPRFAICFVLGWIVNFMSVSSLSTIVISPTRFAVLYSLGNILSMCSTMFLFGPVKQLKSMLDPARVSATIVYMASIALTLFSAFYLHSVFFVMVALSIQLCAMVWYCASYIPFGRDLLKRFFTGCCGSCLGL